MHLIGLAEKGITRWLGGGGRGSGIKGVLSNITLVSVFSIIILTSFSGYREGLPNLVNAS